MNVNKFKKTSLKIKRPLRNDIRSFLILNLQIYLVWKILIIFVLALTSDFSTTFVSAGLFPAKVFAPIYA